MDAVVPILVGLSSILWVVASIVGTIALIRYVMKPIEQRAMQQPLESLRFHLIDIISLAVQWQMLLALGVAMDRQVGGGGPGLLVALVMSAVALAIWFGSIATLNRARIHTSSRRTVYILVQTPLSVVSPFVAAVSGGYLPTAVLWLGFGISEGDGETPATVLAVTLSIFLVSLVGVAALRQIANWIAVEPMQPPPIDKTEPKEQPGHDSDSSAGEAGAAGSLSVPGCDLLNHSDAFAGMPK